MSNKKTFASIFLVVALVGCSTALGAIESIRFTGYTRGLGTGVGLYTAWTGGTQYFGSDTTQNGGLMTIARAAASGGGTFQTFCIEIPENASSSFANYNVVALTNAPVANGAGWIDMTSGAELAIRKLWTLHRGDVLGNGVNGNSQTAGAFQAAVWELSYDYDKWADPNPNHDIDLAKGNFRMDTEVGGEIALATTWLSDLFDGSGNLKSTIALAGIGAWSNDGLQDYIRPLPPPSEAIPEPASLVVWSLLGSAGAAVALRSRKRRGWSDENRQAIHDVISRG